MLSSTFDDLTCKNTELINIIIKNFRKKTKLFRLILLRCLRRHRVRTISQLLSVAATSCPMTHHHSADAKRRRNLLQDQSILFGVDFDDLGGPLAALGSHFPLYFAWWLPRKKFPSLKGGGGCCGSLKISLLCQPLSLRVRSNCYRRF